MAKRNAKGQFTKIDPLPPVVLPVTPPTPRPRPTPEMPTKPWKDKPLIKSRTIASITLTILLFVSAKFAGVDIDTHTIGVGPEGGLSIGEVLLLMGSFLAGWFRVKATGPINGFSSTPGG